MLRVGLTGGIACGKTTVSRLFSDRGSPVVDADVLAREVVAPGSVGLARIVADFGREVVTIKDTLDRKAMRHLIFSNLSAKRHLESLLHPLIRQRMEAIVGEFAQRGCPYCISVVPLFFETGQHISVDRVLVIDCNEMTQIDRLIARDNTTRDEATKILAVQTPRSQRIERADDVIVNDTGIGQLPAHISRLHQLYIQLAAVK